MQSRVRRVHHEPGQKHGGADGDQAEEQAARADDRLMLELACPAEGHRALAALISTEQVRHRRVLGASIVSRSGASWRALNACTGAQGSS